LAGSRAGGGAFRGDEVGEFFGEDVTHDVSKYVLGGLGGLRVEGLEGSMGVGRGEGVLEDEYPAEAPRAGIFSADIGGWFGFGEDVFVVCACVEAD
jgi:hypothetical protein